MLVWPYRDDKMTSVGGSDASTRKGRARHKVTNTSFAYTQHIITLSCYFVPISAELTWMVDLPMAGSEAGPA